jgi:hypothetical protein
MTIFVIVNLYKIFHTKFVDVVMIYCHTKFHMPNSYGSLVIAIKPKTKYRFHAAAMLFHILQKKLL